MRLPLMVLGCLAILGLAAAQGAEPAPLKDPTVAEVNRAPPLIRSADDRTLPATPLPQNDPPSLPTLPSDNAASAAAEDEGFTPSSGFQQWISTLVRQELPDQYEKRKNWGHTTKSFDGVSIQLDDGRLKTHRKYKQANDGKWQMYRVKVVDPDETFDVRVANIRQQADGRVRMEITAVADLEVFGRQALWERGVQIFSISATADARVRLRATTDVATRLDITRLPPDVHLVPEVTAAKLEILDFKLRRISDLSGPLIRALSHAVREALEEKLAEDNAKLVARLNKSIDKKEDKLKLSAADLLESKWAGLLDAQSKAAAPPAER